MPCKVSVLTCEAERFAVYVPIGNSFGAGVAVNEARHGSTGGEAEAGGGVGLSADVGLVVAPHAVTVIAQTPMAASMVAASGLRERTATVCASTRPTPLAAKEQHSARALVMNTNRAGLTFACIPDRLKGHRVFDTA